MPDLREDAHERALVQFGFVTMSGGGAAAGGSSLPFDAADLKAWRDLAEFFDPRTVKGRPTDEQKAKIQERKEREKQIFDGKCMNRK